MTVEQYNPHSRQPPSVSMVKVGTEVVPQRSSPTCATCQSNHRMFLENELLRQRGYASIARQAATLTNHGELGVPSAGSIRQHVLSGHLTQPALERRKIGERRAEQLGMQIMGEDSLVDYMALNELIINRGMERLADGEIEPSMGDVLTAIRNQHSFEALSEKGFDVEAYEQTMFVYFTTAQQFMPPQQFEAMMESLKKNPILRALSQKAQESQEEDDEGNARVMSDSETFEPG